jgi:hypothetical protein
MTNSASFKPWSRTIQEKKLKSFALTTAANTFPTAFVSSANSQELNTNEVNLSHPKVMEYPKE